MRWVRKPVGTVDLKWVYRLEIYDIYFYFVDFSFQEGKEKEDAKAFLSYQQAEDLEEAILTLFRIFRQWMLLSLWLYLNNNTVMWVNELLTIYSPVFIATGYFFCVFPYITSCYLTVNLLFLIYYSPIGGWILTVHKIIKTNVTHPVLGVVLPEIRGWQQLKSMRQYNHVVLIYMIIKRTSKYISFYI